MIQKIVVYDDDDDDDDDTYLSGTAVSMMHCIHDALFSKSLCMMTTVMIMMIPTSLRDLYNSQNCCG